MVKEIPLNMKYYQESIKCSPFPNTTQYKHIRRETVPNSMNLFLSTIAEVPMTHSAQNDRLGSVKKTPVCQSKHTWRNCLLIRGDFALKQTDWLIDEQTMGNTIGKSREACGICQGDRLPDAGANVRIKFADGWAGMRCEGETESSARLEIDSTRWDTSTSQLNQPCVRIYRSWQGWEMIKKLWEPVTGWRHPWSNALTYVGSVMVNWQGRRQISPS